MSEANIIKLIQPRNVDDQLTEILRNGARLCWPRRSRPRSRTFSASIADLKTADGHQRVVRRGHLPEREGDDWYRSGRRPPAACARSRGGRYRPQRIRFSPSILPPFVRRSKSIETLLPILYLKGISTGDSPRLWRRCSARMPPGCRHPPSAV